MDKVDKNKIIYPKLSYTIVGCFFELYNTLRYLDLSEEAWEKALVIVLRERGLVVERQVKHELDYKGQKIGTFYIDIVVNGIILIELKATARLQPIDWAQVLTYLKVTKFKLGFLANFGGSEFEFERIANSNNNSISVDPIYSDDLTYSDDLLYPQLTKELRGILYTVHNELGPGFMHMHYRRATLKELRWHDIPCSLRKKIPIRFRGQDLEERDTRLLIVDNKVLLTPLAVREITPLLKGRLRQYLKILGFSVWLTSPLFS